MKRYKNQPHQAIEIRTGVMGWGAVNLPRGLDGNVHQAYEFSLVILITLWGKSTSLATIRLEYEVTESTSDSKKKLSVKSKIVDVVIDLKYLDIEEYAIETNRTDDKPECIDRLEPIQNLATNVGAKIINMIWDSLNKGPPGWAAEMSKESISKDVYNSTRAMLRDPQRSVI
ncbi:hypothetical protein Tco_0598870 [Tanacetum coccineum]